MCIVVFVSLTALFSVLISMLVKNTLKIIYAGLDDEKIKKEHIEEQRKKQNKSNSSVILNNALLILLCIVLTCTLAFSLYSKFTQNTKIGSIPTLKAVETGSMEKKHKDNTYLEEFNLNDQISTFDLVVLHQLPAEEDLQVFDIVVYENDGYFIIHRIVAIEEPNALHPNERWYVLRGDANQHADEFPVTYSQMRSIYRGESVPFVGSFVIFMQSPAGMLCFLLVLLATIALPIVEKKIQKAIDVRLVAMGLKGQQVTENIYKQPETFIDNTEPLIAITVADSEEISTEGRLFDKFGKRKTFEERLNLLNDEKVEWYNQLVYVLMQIPSIHVNQAKYHELYRQGNKAVAKIVIRGKSLYVYLPFDANNYQGRQYGFEDVSRIKAYAKLPSECKITSRRKLKNVLKLLARFGENIKIERPDTGVNFFKLRKKVTLNSKLYRLPKERKERYKQIVKLMEQKIGVTRWESKNCITFKYGRKPLLKITVKGKSVCVYMAVDPTEYTATKYGIKDVSNIKTYHDYPAMCKVTSDRRLKYVLNIINEKL